MQLNCHLRDLPPDPAPKVTGGSRKAQQCGYCTEGTGSHSPASRARSRSGCTGGTDSWEAGPSSSSPNDLREVGKHVDRERMNFWNLQGRRRFLKGQGRGTPASLPRPWPGQPRKGGVWVCPAPTLPELPHPSRLLERNSSWTPLCRACRSGRPGKSNFPAQRT